MAASSSERETNTKMKKNKIKLRAKTQIIDDELIDIFSL